MQCGMKSEQPVEAAFATRTTDAKLPAESQNTNTIKEPRHENIYARDVKEILRESRGMASNAPCL